MRQRGFTSALAAIATPQPKYLSVSAMVAAALPQLSSQSEVVTRHRNKRYDNQRIQRIFTQIMPERPRSHGASDRRGDEKNAVFHRRAIW